FFVKKDGEYQINRRVRDLCIFAFQNLLADPPLPRMDLVVFRNRLTNLVPSSRRNVVLALHYSVKPGGLLLFEHSQEAGSLTNLFQLEDKKHKIYSKVSRPPTPQPRQADVVRPVAH